MKEIDKLIAQGFKVKISHLRNAKPKTVDDEIHTLTTQLSVRALRARGYEPLSTGGTTVLRLVAPNGLEFKEQVPVSALDHYNKKVGILVVLGRLTKGQAVQLEAALVGGPPAPDPAVVAPVVDAGAATGLAVATETPVEPAAETPPPTAPGS